MKNDCLFCKKTFEFREKLSALCREADDPFNVLLYGVLAYVNQEIDAHLMSHEMEPEVLAERHALHEKTLEVVGRNLKSLHRDCQTHPGYEHGVFNTGALDGVVRGCAECLRTLVEQARQTPVFTAEDAATVARMAGGKSSMKEIGFWEAFCLVWLAGVFIKAAPAK